MAGMEKRRPGKRSQSLSSRLNFALFAGTVGVAAKVRPPRAAEVRLGAGSRVLVFSTAGIGDSLLDSAGIRALAETFPGVRISAVVHHRRPHIAAHNPFLERLFFLKKGPLEFFRLFAELHRVGPWDAILFLSCLDPEARSLGYLLARDRTFGPGWRTDLPWLCATNLDDSALRRAHLAAQAVAVAAAVGADCTTPRMVYEVKDPEHAELAETLRRIGCSSAPGLTLQLGGGGASYRDWPAAHFIELARTLRERGVGPIFLLGGPDHVEKAGRVAQTLGTDGVWNLAGTLPLPLAAALVASSRCVMSTDTGIMHLAFAVGTPTVALLHPRPGAARVGPLWESGRHRVLALEKPLGYSRPEDARMENIPPARVIEAVTELWESRS